MSTNGNEELSIKSIRNMLTLFMEKDYEFVEDFTKELRISRRYFNRCLSYLKDKKSDSDLYLQSVEKVIKLDEHKLGTMKKELTAIVQALNFGIKTKDGSRPFDSIDFFLMTQFDVNDISNNLCNTLSGSEYISIRKFIGDRRNIIANDSYDEKQIQQLIDSRIVVNVQFDSNGDLIPNSGMEIPREDIIKMLDFLKEKKIPVSPRTFTDIRRRYLNNELFQERVRSRKRDEI